MVRRGPVLLAEKSREYPAVFSPKPNFKSRIFLPPRPCCAADARPFRHAGTATRALSARPGKHRPFPFYRFAQRSSTVCQRDSIS